MFAGFDASTRRRFLVLSERATGTDFSVSNEILGTSHGSVRSFGPLSSGAIPQWHPADRRSHASTMYRELEPLPGGLSGAGGIAARCPLCATFPTSRGDKFTDAVRPPQLPLLRDSKSFVKGISLVAPGGQISGSIGRTAGKFDCPQAVPRLNAAYPQGPRLLHRLRESPTESPPTKVSLTGCITPWADLNWLNV